MRHHFVLLVLTTLVCCTNAKGFYSEKNHKQAFKQSRADDLKVCPKCQYDSDCEDGDVCTKNSCFYSEGHGYECRSFPIKDCVACESTKDCMKDNYDPCSIQECVYGRCLEAGRIPHCGYPEFTKTHTLSATAVNGRAKYSAMALDTKTSKLFAVASGAVDLSMLPSFVAEWSCSGHGPGSPQIHPGHSIETGSHLYPNCNPLLFQDLYGLVQNWFNNFSPAEDRQVQGSIGGKVRKQSFPTDNDDGFVLGLWNDRNRVSPFTIAQALAFIDMLTPSWVDVLDWDQNKKFDEKSPEVVARWRPDSGSEIVTDVAAKHGKLAILTRPSCLDGLAQGKGGNHPIQNANPSCLNERGTLRVLEEKTMDVLYEEEVGYWPISVEFSGEGHLVVVNQGPGEAEPAVTVCDTNWNTPRNQENPRCKNLWFKDFNGGEQAYEDRRHEMCLGGEGYIQDELYAFDYQRLTPFRELNAGERSEAKHASGFSARLEPNAVSFANNNYALVSLTINNGVAVIYLGDRYHPASIEGIVCLGVKNMLEEGNAFDGSDEDGGLYPENWPVFALYQPRKVLAVPSKDDNEILFMTANGGAFSVDDVVQVEDINLDPGRFNIPERDITPEKLQYDSAIGKLRVIKSQGRWSTGEVFRYNERDRDEPGHDQNLDSDLDDHLSIRLADKAWRIEEEDTFYEKLYMPGARSVSLWKLKLSPLMDLPTTKARARYAFELSQLWDTGNMLESGVPDEIDALLPLANAAKYFDDQSTGFGPAPTDVVLGHAYGMRIAAVSVTGGNYIAVMNLDDLHDPQPLGILTSAGAVDAESPSDYPDASQSKTSVDTAIYGDSAPKKLIFVEAEDSPTGCPQILATNGGTKSIAVYELGLVGMKCGEGSESRRRH